MEKPTTQRVELLNLWRNDLLKGADSEEFLISLSESELYLFRDNGLLTTDEFIRLWLSLPRPPSPPRVPDYTPRHRIGGDRSDVLYGFDGDDTLEGGGGNDDLRGGDGNDLLIGGDGHDRMYMGMIACTAAQGMTS